MKHFPWENAKMLDVHEIDELKDLLTIDETCNDGDYVLVKHARRTILGTMRSCIYVKCKDIGWQPVISSNEYGDMLIKLNEVMEVFPDIVQLTSDVIDRLAFDVKREYMLMRKREIAGTSQVITDLDQQADEWYVKQVTKVTGDLDADDKLFIGTIIWHIAILLLNGGPNHLLTPTLTQIFHEALAKKWEIDMTILDRGKFVLGQEPKYDFNLRENNWEVLPPYISQLENVAFELFSEARKLSDDHKEEDETSDL